MVFFWRKPKKRQQQPRYDDDDAFTNATPAATTTTTTTTTATTCLSSLKDQIQVLVQQHGLAAVVQECLKQQDQQEKDDGNNNSNDKTRHDASEAKLNQAILDASFEAVIVADDEGKIVKVNQAMLDIFGYNNNDNDSDASEQVVGKNIDMLVGMHAARHKSYMQAFKERNGTSTVLGSKRDLVARRKDGTEFPCKIGIRKVPGTDFVVGFIEDITNQLKANAEAELNQAVLDASFEAIIVADDEGKIIKVNAAMLQIFGFANTQQVVGQNLEILTGEHASHHRDYMKRFQERKASSSILGNCRELVARRQDGTEFPVRIGIRKVPDSKHMVGFIQDITHENTAKRQDRINKSVLESAFDAIILTDDLGNIQHVNPATLSIFKFESEADVIGKNISMLVGKDDADKHDMYMRDFKEREGQGTVLGTKRQLAARRADGSEFPCRIGVRKVPGTALMVGYIQDITSEMRALELAVEKQAAEELLFNMLPKEIADRLKKDPAHIADHFQQATILFADIVGFTRMSNSLSPIQVVEFLNSIFSRFDENLDKYGLNKVKTIGDCYMVTSIPGCADPCRSCAATCHFAMDMIKALEAYNKEHPDAQLHMRIGVNTGPVVAGVVGTKRFLYDIWGDAVNVASRMESTGVPGRVQVTQSVIDAVDPNEFDFEERGLVQVKGIGEMTTFFIKARDKQKINSYWRTIQSSILQGDMRKSSAILELLQSVEQLDYGKKQEQQHEEEQKASLPKATMPNKIEEGLTEDSWSD